MTFFEWREAPPDTQYAVIGDPIGHSLSPLMHMAALGHLRMNQRYVALRVPPEELEDALEHLRLIGYLGLNVTTPHKEAAFAWCTDVDDIAQSAKSVNTLELPTRRGTSTDGQGFLSGLPSGIQSALVLGSGGSARVVVNALLSVGIDVHIWARNPGKAREIHDSVLIDADTGGFDIVINCTSSGLHKTPLPISWKEGTRFAYDLAYAQASYSFLASARAHGVTAIDGLAMLAEQGALAFEWWHKVPAPREIMTRALLRAAKIREADSPSIAIACALLQDRALVAIPTETVYGLAANALDEFAVQRIFETKGRPATNPLIVHVSSVPQAQQLARSWPTQAAQLAAAFWPGPLTMVLPKSSIVPDCVTAGLDSVALRMPDHPVALSVITGSHVPLAAPSANTFTEVSPTRVADLSLAILRGADLVLDGGPCKVGIESTVVSIVDGNVKLLRLGIISKKALEEVLGQSVQQPDDHELKASPGQHPKHYSPRARVRLVDVLEHAASGLTFGTPQSAEQIQMPSSESDYAAKLYAALSHFDWLGVKEIQVERPPIGWVAIWDRLNRASAEDPAE